MSMPLAMRAAARLEFSEAAIRYESLRPALGSDFVAEVQRVLDIVSGQPDRFPIVMGDVREAPLSNFPYCIYYRVKTNRISVIAVFHMSRDPAIWQGRV